MATMVAGQDGGEMATVSCGPMLRARYHADGPGSPINSPYPMVAGFSSSAVRR